MRFLCLSGSASADVSMSSDKWRSKVRGVETMATLLQRQYQATNSYALGAPLNTDELVSMPKFNLRKAR